MEMGAPALGSWLRPIAAAVAVAVAVVAVAMVAAAVTVAISFPFSMPIPLLCCCCFWTLDHPSMSHLALQLHCLVQILPSMHTVFTTGRGLRIPDRTLTGSNC